jgi:hypothetical protein
VIVIFRETAETFVKNKRRKRQEIRLSSHFHQQENASRKVILVGVGVSTLREISEADPDH